MAHIGARRIVAGVVTALLAVPTLAGVELGDVLANFDRVQQSIRTLSSDFTETTRSPLLKEQVVAHGRVYLSKPSSVRWEYSTPEEMRFVIADDKYTGYFPLRKQAEQRNVQRWGEQLFRFLGLGQASDELGKFYNIQVDAGSSATDGTVLLILDPKKKRVRKRMESVKLWVDSTTWLPARVQYSSSAGNVRLIEFEGMSINPELSASLYRVDLPPDVQVSRGFSALSGFANASDN